MNFTALACGLPDRPTVPRLTQPQWEDEATRPYQCSVAGTQPACHNRGSSTEPPPSEESRFQSGRFHQTLLTTPSATQDTAEQAEYPTSEECTQGEEPEAIPVELTH